MSLCNSCRTDMASPKDEMSRRAVASASEFKLDPALGCVGCGKPTGTRGGSQEASQDALDRVGSAP